MHALPRPAGSRSHEVERERAIAALAWRQELVISLAQLEALGLSGNAVRKRVVAGRLFRQHPGAFSLVPTLSRRGQFFAAVLASGRGAVLSHLSAAAEHELRRHDFGPVHVTVPRTGARSRPGIRLHVSGSLTSPYVESLNGLRVTTVERTLTDLADELTPAQLQLAFSTAERKGLVDRDTFVTPRGRRRATKRRHLYTRSGNERAFYRLLARHGLPRPLANIDVAGKEADFIWPEFGLVVEIDAWFTHGNRRNFEIDRLKDEFFDELGLKIRRITDTRLHEDPPGVAGTVRRALGACDYVPHRRVMAWTRGV